MINSPSIFVCVHLSIGMYLGYLPVYINANKPGDFFMKDCFVHTLLCILYIFLLDIYFMSIYEGMIHVLLESVVGLNWSFI